MKNLHVSQSSNNKSHKKIICYKCGTEGHTSNSCFNNKNTGNRNGGLLSQNNNSKWCKFCRTATHNTQNCCKLEKANMINSKQVKNNVEESSFVFMVNQNLDVTSSRRNMHSFLVNCGATSHIVTDDSNFISLDEYFKPSEHFIELADGSRSNNVVLKRGSIQINLPDNTGNTYDITLQHVLLIPSYTQNIFSVQAATEKGATVNFYPNSAELVSNGTIFNIEKEGKLYFLGNDITYVKTVRDLKEWHSVLGHCNQSDILKLEKVVEGMKIGNKNSFDCESCILSKQTKTMYKIPSIQAKSPLEMVGSDLCGPIMPVSTEGFKYVISFIDNFSGYIFVYFIKQKSDATKALQKFLADVAPFGTVRNLLNLVPESEIKKLCTDGGGEYMGKSSKNILLEHSIKHEQSVSYSPHQNGVAERGWCTLFEMGRCMLLESKLSKQLWPYAIMAGAYTRNRCFQQRTQETAYVLLTGRKPNVSNMHSFGSTSFTLEQKRSKLDSRGKKGVFIGYDKESPAYFVYCHVSGKISKTRNVRFTDKIT